MTEKELNSLREMIESNAAQIDILRAFPQYTWRQLQQRYVYNFNHNRWLTTYSGEITHTRFIRWADTEEAQQAAATSLSTGVTPDTRRRC